MISEVLIFIDYDNLLYDQKIKGILDIVTRTLIKVDFTTDQGKVTCQVRLYGGWYSGTDITRKAEDLTIEIQNDFPKIIRVPTSDDSVIKIQTRAELAVSLIQEPSHHIFNTFRSRGKPNNIRIRSKSDLGCTDLECFLPAIKKLLSKGKCPKESCNVDSTIIYRSEQKLVDTMLSCDLVFTAKSSHNLIILISGDDDFIPPLRSAVLMGSEPIQVYPRISNRRGDPGTNNINFKELEL